MASPPQRSAVDNLKSDDGSSIFDAIGLADGDLGAITLLLSRSPASANARNSQGATALMMSMVAHHVQDVAVAKALVKAGAELDAVDSSGESALHYAARWGRGDMIEMLLAEAATSPGLAERLARLTPTRGVGALKHATGTCLFLATRHGHAAALVALLGDKAADGRFGPCKWEDAEVRDHGRHAVRAHTRAWCLLIAWTC